MQSTIFCPPAIKIQWALKKLTILIQKKTKIGRAHSSQFSTTVTDFPFVWRVQKHSRLRLWFLPQDISNLTNLPFCNNNINTFYFIVPGSNYANWVPTRLIFGLRNIGHEISTKINVWLSTQLLNKTQWWFMQYKYTENPAHGKWITHIKSKHIIFIFEEKVGRNISSGQPTLVSVVIWSKIKNNNKAKNKAGCLKLRGQD